MQHDNFIAVNNRITGIKYPVSQVIFFHAIKKISRVLSEFFNDLPFYCMSAACVIISFKKGPVFIFLKVLMWQSIFLHLQIIIIKYFERNDSFWLFCIVFSKFIYKIFQGVFVL